MSLAIRMIQNVELDVLLAVPNCFIEVTCRYLHCNFVIPTSNVFVALVGDYVT